MWEGINSLIANYPTTVSIIAICIIFAIIVIVVMYVVAFYQGRSISFWPPKLGEAYKIDAANFNVGDEDLSDVPYVVPSSLSYYRYSEIKDGRVTLTRRRILAVKSNVTETINVSYAVNTNAISVDSAISISHPDLMQPLTNNEKTKIYAIKIQAESNREYLVSSESTVEIETNSIPSNPNPSDPVMSTLHNNFLNKSLREFVGSRMPDAPVYHHRIVVEFAKGYAPSKIHTLQINESGEVIKGDGHSEFILARSKNMSHAILDINNPKPKSGVYLWWEWESA